jgi:ABC-type transporter Mla subunit MlaD
MSSTTNLVKASKASALASVRALLAGTKKNAPNGSLTFGNATYTADSLVQMLQSLADAMTLHDTAQAKAKDVLLALHDVTAKVHPVLRAYRAYLVATYGNATQTLADYGLTPPKARAPRTSEQKAESAAKARATRKARATTSKKQKALIHGAVPAPAQPAPTPTPAAVPPSAPKPAS